MQEVSSINLSYGKLVELLMYIRHKPLFNQLLQITENKLQNYKCNLPSPIAVFGDASASMQTAINTSGIITSLLCSLTKADLTLFRDVACPVENPPATIQEAIKFAQQMKAHSATAPAASLYPYYMKKKKIKTFILVTDEEENTTHLCRSNWGYNTSQAHTQTNQGYMFAELFAKYYQEVYPAKLVFISFSKTDEDAFMVKALKGVMGTAQAEEIIDVFKMDVRNPDLNRVDYILEKLSLQTESTQSSSSSTQTSTPTTSSSSFQSSNLTDDQFEVVEKASDHQTQPQTQNSGVLSSLISYVTGN